MAKWLVSAAQLRTIEILNSSGKPDAVLEDVDGVAIRTASFSARRADGVHSRNSVFQET